MARKDPEQENYAELKKQSCKETKILVQTKMIQVELCKEVILMKWKPGH